jgi:signal transduction histidine kinase
MVLAVAVISLLVQVAALGQVIAGQGQKVGIFDHIAFALVAFLWLALGLLVFLQRRVGRAGRVFLLCASAGSIFIALGPLYKVSMADAFSFTAGLLIVPPLFVSFARAFPGDRPWRRTELLLYVLPVALVIPGARSILSGQTTLIWRLTMVLVGLYLVGAIAQATYDLVRARTAEQAAQSRALVFGLVAGTVPGIFSFIGPLVLTGSLGVSTSWLPMIILLFLIAMSYAVLLFEFSEADLIVRRGVVYGALTLVIILAYAGLGALLTAGGTTATSPAGGAGFVAVTVIVGAAFTPIRYAALRLVDWVLYGRRTDRWELLQALSARLATLMQPEDVGNVLVQEVTLALHLRGAFFLAREGDHFVVQHSAEAPSRSVARYDPVPPGLVLEVATVQEALGDPPAAVLIVHRKPATARHRGALKEQYVVLDTLHAALSIPFITRSGLDAVLCLQPKLAHDAFDADDLELLAPVIRQATAALDNALLFKQLAEKVDELRHAYRRIAQEQEAERARLARELHDGTAQELAGLITLAAVAERQMNGDGPVKATLERLRSQAEDAYQGVRRASHALRPLMLDDFGLSPTLDRYLGQFQESTGILVDSAVEHVDGLPPEVELALFRVVQECMENIRKHSGARRALVSLGRQEGEVVLTVSDDGHGMALDRGRGIGLAGMRERIAAIGGAIEVASEVERGVRIEARVPMEEQWRTGVLELS